MVYNANNHIFNLFYFPLVDELLSCVCVLLLQSFSFTLSATLISKSCVWTLKVFGHNDFDITLNVCSECDIICLQTPFFIFPVELLFIVHSCFYEIYRWIFREELLVLNYSLMCVDFRSIHTELSGSVVYTEHQHQRCDNSWMTLAILFSLKTPFWSDSILFNENSIASITAELLHR